MNVIKIQRNAININKLISTFYETMCSSLVARYFTLIISVKFVVIVIRNLTIKFSYAILTLYDKWLQRTLKFYFKTNEKRPNIAVIYLHNFSSNSVISCGYYFEPLKKKVKIWFLLALPYSHKSFYRKDPSLAHFSTSEPCVNEK